MIVISLSWQCWQMIIHHLDSHIRPLTCRTDDRIINHKFIQTHFWKHSFHTMWSHKYYTHIHYFLYNMQDLVTDYDISSSISMTANVLFWDTLLLFFAMRFMNLALEVCALVYLHCGWGPEPLAAGYMVWQTIIISLIQSHTEDYFINFWLAIGINGKFMCL